VTSSDSPSASDVRAELDRILASEIFVRSDRLSAYLKFIVERTLAGDGETLKEQVIAVELYGKETDFSTAADPIVRVDARRLRDRLREYYASAPAGAVVITVLKGSYTPQFIPVNAAPTPTSAPVAPPLVESRRSRRWWIGGAAAVTMLGIAAGIVAGRLGDRASEPTRLLTVTAFPGAEEDPAISPDGNFVAFSWSRSPDGLNADIWVKAVDGDAMRQLTNTPEAGEKFPEWSRDGQHITFTRLAKGSSSVWMVSALGGAESLVVAASSGHASWLPDGKSVVTVSRTATNFSLVNHTLTTGERQELAAAPPGMSIAHPKVSPDGRAVAFLEFGTGRSAVFLKTLGGGEPTQLTEWFSGAIGGLTWTPDGRELIFARPELSGRRMVRMSAERLAAGTPVSGVPHGAMASSTSRLRPGGGYRVAMMSGQPDISLRLVDLAPARGDTILRAHVFCDSTRTDVPGRFSPDGSHIAFVSDRRGSQQVWVARRDQPECRSLTQLQEAMVEVGSWSPDGRSLVFSATIANNTDVYIVSIDGGPVRRVTSGPAFEADPDWSRDGQWIYFSSEETGRSEIWKMSVDGRTRVKLTSDGGFDPRESADGQFLYFAKAPRTYSLGPPTRLERISTQGGAPSLVMSGILPGAWDVAGDTIVFLIALPGANTKVKPDIVARYDIVTQQVTELGALEVDASRYFVRRFLSVSPDARWAILPHVDRHDRDILVLDNFR
jgi:Tol biopolymer transport system component